MIIIYSSSKKIVMIMIVIKKHLNKPLQTLLVAVMFIMLMILFLNIFIYTGVFFYFFKSQSFIYLLISLPHSFIYH